MGRHGARNAPYGFRYAGFVVLAPAMTGSWWWWWVLPLVALGGLLLVVRSTTTKGSRRRGDAPVRRRANAVSSWAIDIIAGGLIGVCIVGGLGQSALVTGGTVANEIDILVFVLGGVTVGVVFMRVIRHRRPLSPTLSEEDERSQDQGSTR